MFQVFEFLNQQVKVYGAGDVKVIFIFKRKFELFLVQRFIERVLREKSGKSSRTECMQTIDRITTHGRSSEETISTARDVLPEPELPAIPMMLVSVHGGEYRARCIAPKEATPKLWRMRFDA